MKQKILKFGLIGCGRIAKRHAEVLNNIDPSVAQLVAVCDHRPEKADSFAEQYNVKSFHDIDQMMQTIEIDVVAILTESGLHAQHTIKLAKYKTHIIVEKPMALTISDAHKMIEECDKHGVNLHVVKQNRFNLPVIALKTAIDIGRFGKINLATMRVRWNRPQSYYDMDPWRGTWALDGGVLSNQAIHHIDLLQWLVGEVESVFAKSNTAVADIEAEDTAVALLKFKNGALGIIEATTATQPNDLEGSVSILGERGTAEIGGFAVNEIKHWDFSESLPEDKDIFEHYSSNPPDVYGFGHASFYQDVVDSIINKVPPSIDGNEGKKSINLLVAIYQSIEQNKEVFVNDLNESVKLGA